MSFNFLKIYENIRRQKKILNEEYMNDKKIFYHISKENDLKLEHRNLWVINKKFGIPSYSYTAMIDSPNNTKVLSSTATIYRLLPKKGLNIFNLYSNDLRKLLKYINDPNFNIEKENLRLKEYTRIYDNYNKNKNICFYFKNKDEIKNKLNELLSKTKLREYSNIKLFSAIIKELGFDGYSEDESITTLSKDYTYFHRGSICIFDAAECLKIDGTENIMNLHDEEFIKIAKEKGKKEPNKYVEKQIIEQDKNNYDF